MTVKVVTDSTSDIPPEMARSLGITVVPLNVTFGTETFRDGVDISADQFYDRLISGSVTPTTSQPSPGDFLQVFDELGGDADAILAVHLSSKESGTYNSAVQAKDQSDVRCPIEVLDSEQFSMGLGMIVIAAAQAASDGGSLDEVVAVARGAMARSQCFALFDTLDYLQRGGRVGKAQALVGSILKIKPMIIIRDGRVHPLAKPRTFRKGVARLQEVARGFEPVESVCVLHSTTPDIAGELAEALRELLPEGSAPFVARFGPVLGTYTGPGAVGIGLLRAE